MKKTYHIITIGCQMNKSDSERMASFLEELGYEMTEEKYQADLVIINTCGVRQLAEDRIYGFIPRIKKENPKVKIVVTGCLSGRTDVQRRMNEYVDLWLLTKDMTKLAEFLNKADKRELPDSYLKIKPKYDSAFSALVPIGNGCDNFCTYCVVPHARGREVYRPADDIINEVKELVGKGYKEIILIAQNVNSYESIINYELSITNKGNGKKVNKKINFAELIRLVNDIPGNFWIRFATSHPKDMSDELIKVLAECEKACHHIHLPVQAGDDEILARMNRKYTVEHYLKLIKKIKTAMPDASITTDIIVGFPGESKKQFAGSVKLAKEANFDMIFIGKYSPRPGTAAQKMKDDVSKLEKKNRELALTKVYKKSTLENNNKDLGLSFELLVETASKGYSYGRTRTNKYVRIVNNPLKENLIGKFVVVKIVKANDFGLDGELVLE